MAISKLFLLFFVIAIIVGIWQKSLPMGIAALIIGIFLKIIINSQAKQNE